MIGISSSGLTAERLRMDIISQNIANANTTRTSSGTPYRRKVPIFREIPKNTTFSQVLENAQNGNVIGNGVEVKAIKEVQSPFKRVYDPGHPDADAQGYVQIIMPPIVKTIFQLF